MIKQETINYFENETPSYTVLIGVDGYNSLADNESYFDNYYLPKYIEKITLIIMILMSWYPVKIDFNTEDTESKFLKYRDKSITPKDVNLLVKLISCSMHNAGYLHFLFTDDDDNEFLMYIYGDSTIGFCNITQKTKEYVESQINKQGLSLSLDTE